MSPFLLSFDGFMRGDEMKEELEVRCKLRKCPWCKKSVILYRRPLWQICNGITSGYVGNYEYQIACENPMCTIMPSTRSVNDIYMPSKRAIERVIALWNWKEKKEKT